MTKLTVAWCSACEHYCSEKEIGRPCPQTDCSRKLVKRVGYVCACCEERFFFKTKLLARLHEDGAFA